MAAVCSLENIEFVSPFYSTLTLLSVAVSFKSTRLRDHGGNVAARDGVVKVWLLGWNHSPADLRSNQFPVWLFVPSNRDHFITAWYAVAFTARSIAV